MGPRYIIDIIGPDLFSLGELRGGPNSVIRKN